MSFSVSFTPVLHYVTPLRLSPFAKRKEEKKKGTPKLAGSGINRKC